MCLIFQLCLLKLCPDLVTNRAPLYTPKCLTLSDKSCEHSKDGAVYQLFVSVCSIQRKQN